MFKSIEDFQTFSAEQMQLAAKSATLLSQGMQQFFTETTALSKQTMESGADAMQNLMASRSIDKAMQVQADFAKSTYDSMVAGSSKIGGIVSSTAQDLLKPLEGVLTRMQGAVQG